MGFRIGDPNVPDDDSTDTSSTDDSTDTSVEDTDESTDADVEADTSDDGSDTSEDDSEDTDTTDSAEITRKYFTDPESVPKELRGPFKEMQGIFTRRMQEATAVVKQARQFQAIVNDPRFQAWAKSLNENPKSTSSNDTADDEAEDAPLTAKHLQKLEEKITSKMEERDRAEKQERYNRVMIKRANQFKKDNPDWKLYANRMDDILEDNPKLSYEDALFLAKKSTMQKQNKMAILKSKKNAKSLKPTTSEGSDTNKTTGKRTFQQAAQDAINSLTKQGFKIPR